MYFWLFLQIYLWFCAPESCMVILVDKTELLIQWNKQNKHTSFLRGLHLIKGNVCFKRFQFIVRSHMLLVVFCLYCFFFIFLFDYESAGNCRPAFYKSLKATVSVKIFFIVQLKKRHIQYIFHDLRVSIWTVYSYTLDFLIPKFFQITFRALSYWSTVSTWSNVHSACALRACPYPLLSF